MQPPKNTVEEMWPGKSRLENFSMPLISTKPRTPRAVLMTARTIPWVWAMSVGSLMAPVSSRLMTLMNSRILALPWVWVRPYSV